MTKKQQPDKRKVGLVKKQVLEKLFAKYLNEVEHETGNKVQSLDIKRFSENVGGLEEVSITLDYE